MPKIFSPSRTRKQVVPTIGCKKGYPKKKTNVAPPTPGLGFLKHVFHPIKPLPPVIFHREMALQSLAINVKHFNQSFNASLSVDVNMPYPNGVLTLIKSLKTIAKNSPHLKNCEVLLVERKGKLALAIENTCSLRNCIYLIDIKPAFDLLDRGEFASAYLLFSIFQYLYVVNGVGLYSDAVQGCYAMCTEAEEEEVENEYMALGKSAFDVKVRCQKILRGKRHLRALWSRAQRFKPANLAQMKLASVAMKFAELYRQYGRFSLLDTLPQLDTDQLEELEDWILPDDVFSFCYGIADPDFCQYHLDNINYSLMEKNLLLEPVEPTLYLDEPNQTPQIYNSSFVNRYLDLLEELAQVLELLDYEKFN